MPMYPCMHVTVGKYERYVDLYSNGLYALVSMVLKVHGYSSTRHTGHTQRQPFSAHLQISFDVLGAKGGTPDLPLEGLCLKIS